MSIQGNIKFIQAQLHLGVELVCVSKFHPVSALQEAYDGGQRIFGESKVQELCDKHEQLPNDIEWHFIGHLQTNKVKFIAPFVSLIHGVDSEKLLQEINRQGEKLNRVIPCLLQVHIAQEETKFGFSPEELSAWFCVSKSQDYPFVQICGLMGMASYTENQTQIHAEFRVLKTLFENLKLNYFSSEAYFKELSIGMSGDYQIAMQEGSTLVRIGSAIFGPRLY